jgi:uncharacterized membrane protein YbhN (UPF0104 family)
MTRKRFLFLLLILVVLGGLIWLQIHAWKKFDWDKFLEGAEGLNYWKVLGGVLLIYAADFLRAIRWKIFLRPTRPRASWWGLVPAQYIGFTGLALLGRPGEFVRPYLIAKRENVSVASQIAIWLVERVFDMGAVALLFTIDVFYPTSSLRDLDHYDAWRKLGYFVGPGFILFVLLVWLLWARGPAVATWFCRRLSGVSETVANNLEKKITALSAGLHTIHSFWAFLQVSGLSLVIWCLVALAYRQVTHAYPPDTGLPDLDLPQVTLLMFASVAGGIVQLPLVGGGSQLATIAVLSQTFGYSDAPELAVSCGMLLWLVTFMAVIPLGLVLAHRERLSLRRLTAESEAEVETSEARGPSLPVP